MSAVEDGFVDIRVNPADIFQLRVMLESYEGLGYMTTVREDSSVVRIHFLLDQEREIRSLIRSWEQEGLVAVMAEGVCKDGDVC